MSYPEWKIQRLSLKSKNSQNINKHKNCHVFEFLKQNFFLMLKMLTSNILLLSFLVRFDVARKDQQSYLLKYKSNLKSEATSLRKSLLNRKSK